MKKKIMDKILRSWRSLAIVAGMKKQMTTQNRQKSNAKKIFHKKILQLKSSQ